MANTIEVAKTGRATCRGCGEKIAKDVVRYGEEVPNAFSEEGGTSYRWLHLACAAKKHANDLRTALKAYDSEIPDRAALDAIIEANAHPDFPYAEIAANGRAKCRVCREAVTNGSTRVAFERMYDTGMGMTKTAGWVHSACVPKAEEVETMGRDGILAALRTNSPREEDVATVEKDFPAA
ncbi:hypothetical protein BH09MYX1_BH09MYX1_14910 [soil metagenome]